MRDPEFIELKNRFLLGVGIVILFAIPIANVYTKAILSETNIELEEVKNKIQKQQNTNDSLKMEISELASLDKIQIVAQEEGLQYINENIIVVKDNEE